MRLGAAAAILLLWLAGCGAPPEPVSTPSCGAPCPVPPITLNDCRELAAYLPAQEGALRARLPADYPPVARGGIHVLRVVVLACTSAVLDNRTVLHDPRIAFVQAVVAAPEGRDAPGREDRYLLEATATHPALAERLTRGGLPTLLGDIAVALDGQPYRATATRGDAALGLTFAGRELEDPAFGWAPSRLHSEAGGVPHWADVQTEGTLRADVLAGTVAFAGGAAEELAARPGVMAVQGFLYAGRVELELHVAA